MSQTQTKDEIKGMFSKTVKVGIYKWEHVNPKQIDFNTEVLCDGDCLQSGPNLTKVQSTKDVNFVGIKGKIQEGRFQSH